MLKQFFVFLSMCLLLSTAVFAQEAVSDDVLVDELDGKTLEQVADGIVTEEDVSRVANEIATEDPGAIPGDGLGYAFKRLGERLSLAMTRGEEAKAEKQLVFAKRRLLEGRKAALENRADAVEEAQQRYADLVEKVRARVARAESENALRSVIALQENLRKHEAIAEETRRRIAEAEVTEEQKEALAARIAAFREKQKEEKTRLAERRTAIRERLKEAQNATDLQLEEIEDEAEAAVEAGIRGQRVSAEQFLRILETKIGEAEEKLAGAEGNTTEAENTIALAKSLAEEAREALEADELERARELAREGRRLVMAQLIRSALKEELRRDDTGVGAELRERLDVHREQVDVLRERRREEAENLRDRIGEKHEELRERLDRHVEIVKERRDVRSDGRKQEFREKQRQETRTQIRDAEGAREERRTEVRTRTEDGRTETRMKVEQRTDNTARKEETRTRIRDEEDSRTFK